MNRPILDRRVPTTWAHVEKHPLQLKRTAATVEVDKLNLPADWQRFYDQGQEGACVGFGLSLQMSSYNRVRYDAPWLYVQAQYRDEWPTTPPEEGTSLRAGYDVLRTVGHRRVRAGRTGLAMLEEGIVEVNQWATLVDQIRTTTANKNPAALGINWYDGFYKPEQRRGANGRPEWWMPPQSRWGRIAGGHCIFAPLASDKRQAVGLTNSWGRIYPWPVWIAYEDLQRLLNEDGEAAVVTDRP